MSGSHFRFLHAGSLLVDQPLGDLPEVPEPLADLLVDAPHLAAQKVLDAAIEERVDFVVLTGDLLDLAQPSPRALGLLVDRFDRLHENGIKVYWIGGRFDPPQDWPTSASLPRSVHIFPSTHAEEISHFRGERPVANIVGRSWHGTTGFQVNDIKSDADGLPTIVIAYGQCDVHHSTEQMVDYWALGGQSERQTFGTPQHVIHYPGSPQGRSPDETGPHGCTLVHVAGDRTIRTQFMPTDAVRWHTERLALEEETTLDGARRLLTERVKQLKAEAESRPLIVSWKIRGGAHLAGPAARRDLAAEWQEWLRKDFFLSGNKPVVWTHTVELDQPALPAAWFDEESMLGDFLRNLRGLADQSYDSVDLSTDIPQPYKTAALADLARWTEEEHQSVLAEAALTGAQLLGAGDRDG